ncbi:hypothetical protein A5721_23880 [Mycobacterium vulneris]|nr:hypothetical protein A5721_23880 [Mycolicibacterium vulneris]
MTFSPAENDDLIAAETLLTDIPMSPVTVDGWLRTEHRAHVTRMLRQIAVELALVDVMFPRPIMERVGDRAAQLRGTRSIRRYRGTHRRGIYTVAAIAADVERQRPAARAAHRASLRRRTDGMVWIGSRYISVPVYPGPGVDAPVATLTLMPPDYAEATMAPCDDAPTGPILIDSEEAGSC